MFKPKDIIQLLDFLDDLAKKSDKKVIKPDVDLSKLKKFHLTSQETGVHLRYARANGVKFDISDWDFSHVESATGFGNFLRDYVHEPENALDKLDFSHLKSIDGMLDYMTLNKPHKFDFASAETANNLFTGSTINAPIEISLPKAVSINRMLYIADVYAPVKVENANLVRDVEYAYDTNNDYKYDVTYLHKFADTPGKRKLLERYKELADKFNKEYLPKLLENKWTITPRSLAGLMLIDDRKAMPRFVPLNSVQEEQDVRRIIGDEGMKDLAEMAFIHQSTGIVPARADKESGVVVKIPANPHRLLDDNFKVNNLSPAQGIKGKYAFRYRANLEEARQGNPIPYASTGWFEKRGLRKMMADDAAEVARLSATSSSLRELVQKTICT